MSKSHKLPHTQIVPIDWSEKSSFNFTLDEPPFPPSQMVLANALFSALISGLGGIVNEVQMHYDAFSRGEISGTEYAAKVAEASSKRATFSGGKAVAAFSLQEVIKAMGDKWGKEFFKQFARSNVMTMMAFGAIDQTIDTYKFKTGALDLRNYKVNSVENAGSVTGALVGGAAGALAGTFLPIGMFWGATLGSYLGSSGGAMTGRTLGENYFPKEEGEGNTTTIEIEGGEDENNDD